ncbi:hypothetical protein FRB94_004011 [Tulasnella sp. JGI-2019a]|nr:hypothetical protein FRB93_003344 [Tulasnella sp. JGI-2019a]KAG9002269.1 hypothetical protein FRB94_004011 [Tulasnella sp. JGI-2019a]KAG9032848.1 hypothetical protein FRB95_000932 [Tulasnella sp. JGI-2019a]
MAHRRIRPTVKTSAARSLGVFNVPRSAKILRSKAREESSTADRRFNDCGEESGKRGESGVQVRGGVSDVRDEVGMYKSSPGVDAYMWSLRFRNAKARVIEVDPPTMVCGVNL